MKVGIGHSELVEATEAIEEAINQCKEGLDGAIPSSAILFSAICYEYSDLLENIQSSFPGIQVIGCTTDGEFSSVNSFLEDSVLLICFSSEKITLSSGSGTNISNDYNAAVTNALNEARKGLDDDPKICITYFDGLTGNGTDVLDALQEQLGKDVFIFGGTASDQWEFQKTNQFHNTSVLNDAVTVLLIGGDVAFSSGVATGRVPFGKKFKITKVDKNVVYEIDNQNASEFYTKYFGNVGRAPSEGPFAVFIEGSDEFYLRPPLGTNDDGSINFAANIPEGATVQLTNEKKEGVVQAAAEAINTANKNFDGKKIDLVLVTSCGGRKLVLGSRTAEEIEIIKSIVSPEIAIGGFYGYGEICPLQDSGKTKFHNNTVVTLLLGEK